MNGFNLSRHIENKVVSNSDEGIHLADCIIETLVSYILKEVLRYIF